MYRLKQRLTTEKSRRANTVGLLSMESLYEYTHMHSPFKERIFMNYSQIKIEGYSVYSV